MAGSLELTAINQLWIADITYIRLETEFVYLAVVLDAYSRRVIGWALGRTLEDDLTLCGATHGVAFAFAGARLIPSFPTEVYSTSRDYTDLLKQHQVGISMSRKGNPYDNAACEIVHEDVEVRRGLPPGIPRPG